VPSDAFSMMTSDCITPPGGFSLVLEHAPHLLAALSPQRRLCREPETAGQSRAAYRFPLDIDASIEAAGFRMHRDVMRESP